MKTMVIFVRSLAFVILLSGATKLHGQGLIQIIAQPPTRVTDCDTGLLVGTGYMAELMVAPEGTTDRNQFVRLGAAAPIVNGFLPFSGTRTINFPGSSVSLFASAWETAFGSSYDKASLVPGAHVGQSQIVSVQVGPLTPPVPTTSQIRIPDFQVCPVPVPEPSTIGLAILGLGSLFLRRRRNA